MATGPATPLEQFSANMPEFLQTGSSRDIPATVTAHTWNANMPVAFEPVPTPRRQPSRRVQIAAAERDDEKEVSSSPDGDKPSINRRSTMPSKKAMSMMMQSPPLLYPSLTPSCERCETDDDEFAIHCSAVYCYECELWLCGSDPIEDGMPSLGGSAAADITKPKPMECNYRLHRHSVMQGHVRIPASTAMQLEKLVKGEAAKDEKDRKSRKDLLLQLFALPMKGVVWQYESLKSSDTWIDFDAATQNSLEKVFVTDLKGKSSKAKDHYDVSVKLSKPLQLNDQYEVTMRSSEKSGVEWYMLNTLTMKKTKVRRLDDLVSLRSSTQNVSLPNSRPSSAAHSRAQSRAASRANSPSASRRGSATAGINVGKLALDVSAQNTPLTRSGLTSPVVFPGSGVSSPSNAVGSTNSFSPLASSRRPGLQRHASLDVQQMASYTEWNEDQWRAFGKDEKKLTPGAPGTVGHEEADIAEERKNLLRPLFEMERGNPLLLAVYHNSFTAVLILLKKGYSPNSITSWTRLTALQLACMNGNTEIAECLIDNGANPAQKGSSNTMALEYAVKSGQVKLVELLLKLRHPPDSSSSSSKPSHRCIAYSDLLLREKRRHLRRKRSTWIDIAESPEGSDEERGVDSVKSTGLESLKGKLSKQAAAAAGKNESKQPEEDFSIGDSMDDDAGLYPHLLTEALNVPPLLAHTTGVLELLLNAMLHRAKTMDPSPAFELSRYHEWLSSVVSSASVERLQFLLANREKYTAHLEPLDSVSQDFTENLTDDRYARAVLKTQPSLDALLFQAAQSHPLHAKDEEDDDHVLETIQPGSPVPSPSRATSHPFALLLLLLQTGANLNHIEVDASEGTQLSPLFMALRDRKPHLVRWLVQHGATVDTPLRVIRLDLPADHRAQADEECVTDADGDSQWFRSLGWEAYCLEECGYATEEVEEMRAVIEEGKAQQASSSAPAHTTRT
jgi:hypothetical protein